VRFFYITGEEVQAGDRIRFGGSGGFVEFLADPDSPSSATDWYVQTQGSGCMLVTEKFGSVFLRSPEDDEDLELISRGSV
jgi:hypothetical protein